MIRSKFIFNAWIILFLTFCFGIHSFGEQEGDGMMERRLSKKLQEMAKTAHWRTLDALVEGVVLFSFGLQEPVWIYKAPEGFEVTLAALSPDGRQVAFWKSPRGGGRGTYFLYLQEVEGGPPTKIAEFAETGFGLCWSRDSRRLVFSASQDNKSKMVFVYIFDPDAQPGKTLTKLDLSWERYGAGITTQAWSPDGSELVYLVRERSGGRIMIYNLTTKVVRVLTEGNAPAWSPKGDWIAYEIAGSLRRISPNGQRKEILLQDPSPREDYIRHPILWSPDGAFLFFSRTLASDPVGQLPHVMEVSTRREEELPPDYCGGVYGGSLSWAGKNFSN